MVGYPGQRIKHTIILIHYGAGWNNSEKPITPPDAAGTEGEMVARGGAIVSDTSDSMGMQSGSSVLGLRSLMSVISEIQDLSPKTKDLKRHPSAFAGSGVFDISHP